MGERRCAAAVLGFLLRVKVTNESRVSEGKHFVFVNCVSGLDLGR